MRYRFQNHLSNGECITAKHKVEFSTLNGDHRDYHPHYELYFCCEHKPQNVTINGQSTYLDTPSVILSAPFSIHSMFTADGEDAQLDRHVIYFNENAVSLFDESLFPKDFFKVFSNCIFPLTDEQSEKLFPIIEKITDTKTDDTQRNLLFALLINDIDKNVSREARIAYGTTSYYIIEVLKYIYSNLSKNISSDSIAAEFHVSRAKLDRDFRRFVGRSVHNAVMDCRLACACDMLSSTELSVKEIAMLCGFESEYYFYSFFKRGTGKTPLAWRRMMQVTIKT